MFYDSICQLTQLENHCEWALWGFVLTPTIIKGEKNERAATPGSEFDGLVTLHRVD
jgi:hypothetical protein